MRRPLFWKLLLGSWLSLVLVGAGNALLFRIYGTAARSLGVEIMTQYGELELAAATHILKNSGPAAVADFLKSVSAQEGQTEIFPGENAPQKPDPEATVVISRIARTPSGPYTLVFSSFGSRFFSIPPLYASFAIQLLVVDLVVVSFLSFLIAQYLAVPIRRLRFGLKRVAEGDLTVRVSGQIGNRRDEVSDLAHDFDSMADRLQHVLEARERLLHHISHEIRSPLARLQLAVDLARQNPVRALDSLERIEHEAKQLNEMVGELLESSRADFNASVSDTSFEVVELLAIVASDAMFEAEAKCVTVKTDLPMAQDHGSAQTIISGNPELLRKGFDNVLRNALRVSPVGGTVTVRLTTQAGKLRIEVSDEGPGVPDADLERIFEPFVRLQGQSQSSGFGLGLAIARSAAKAHHAAIWAENRSPHGLIIVFELPFSAPG